MSTKRPLLGMKRVTEVTCSEKPGKGLSQSTNKLQESLTIDEFAVLENKHEELRCARPRVEQVFKVAFTIIGLLDHADAHKSKPSRQIWLQLKGKRDDVSNAKEYLKGLCDPELQEEQHYPVEMHCIFAGARGLFLDQLLRDTSADVLVAEPGHLRLLGRAEPVVMAQSRVQQFIALFQEKQSLPGDREQGVKRAFKAFVEERDDKYTMELLLLPSALKEELLGLAHSPASPTPSLGQTHVLQTVLGEPDQDRSQSSTPVTELSNRILDTSFDDRATTGVPARAGASAEVVLLNGRHSHKRRSSENETRDTKRQYSLERRDESLEMERQTEREKRERESRTSCRPKTPLSSDTRARTIDVDPIVLDSSEGALDDWEAVSPETNLRCLVNFFKTMGYQQELVERVIRETGQSEDTFLLLERIVEETQLCNKGQIGGKGPKSFSPWTPPELSPSSSSTVPCSKETECRLSKAQVEPGPSKESIRSQCRSSNSLGHRRYGSSSVSSTQAVALKRTCSAPRGGAQEVITIDDDIDATRTTVITGSRLTPTIAMEHLESQSGFRSDFLSRGGGGTGGGVTKEYMSRGATQTLGGPVKLESVKALRSNPHWLAAPNSAYQSATSSSYQTICHSRTSPLSTEPLLPPVTGMNRFQQSLKTPYTLTLPNELGKPEFRHIIIDGSNVAMAHGLHRFFSCRGIAIAVESFWSRGHREITVFVPQWRQKRDRFTTEQHFLNQLEDLRLLSFTPSREVCGQRISSHDDRFLLHLAEKTDGVIVTNDNLRDFVNTSDSWRRIIQERLLQFTFVEDLFMIPDDPLGKHGPHLEIFLCKDNRRPQANPPPLRIPETLPPNTLQHRNPPPHHQLGPTPSFNPQSGPPSHWPNSGPPDWHPPRAQATPSTSTPPQRTLGETLELKRKLYNIFPDQKQRIDRILNDNPYMRDLNALSALLLG